MSRIRTIDLFWLIFLGALAAVGASQPSHTIWEWVTLFALGAVQIAEPHLGVTESTRRTLAAIGIKMGLCYWLVWSTGGLESSYYFIFLLPIVSCASTFELSGSLLGTALASGLYLAHALYVPEEYYVTDEGKRELTVRVLFFFLSAILVNRLATDNRRQTERLAQANRELSEAQAEVRRSERLAALGQLSAGLAHELRNPLGVISASAELLGKQVASENAVAKEVAGFILSEVDRTNSLVTRFLDFARPSPLHRSVSDLNEIVERTVADIERKNASNGGKITITKDLRPIDKFSFDTTLIESSISNIVQNAADAIAEGGDLRISTWRNGEFVEIVVTDTGPGIAPEQMENIFNPFFTTKPRGVGLGLALVSKFVDGHGGKISVSSRPGEGATFRIQLPFGIDT